jgi:hypothetical protein
MIRPPLVKPRRKKLARAKPPMDAATSFCSEKDGIIPPSSPWATHCNLKRRGSIP